MHDVGGHGRLDRYGAVLIFIGGLLAILFLTLMPFNFGFHALNLQNYINGFDLGPSSFADVPHNILLFAPFGFGLAAVLDQNGWSKSRVFGVVLASGFLLTLLVESLQHFLVVRQPSVADIITNTLGALIGLASFRVWQNRERVVAWIDAVLSKPRNIIAGLVVYLIVLLMLAWSLSFVSGFYGWDENYRMMLGNERTGDRQWLGTVHDLVILDRVLEQDEMKMLLSRPVEFVLTNDEGLLAYYPLSGEAVEADLSGNQPDLGWRNAEDIETNRGFVQFDEGNWLETDSPVSDLTERIQESSRLTFRISVNPAEPDQFGPARIVSISEDPYFRNLMFGQEGTGLVMRYRSIMTGENGEQPQIIFPKFFTNSESVDFLVSFDGVSIDFIDSRTGDIHSFEVVPSIAFYAIFVHLFLGENFADSEIYATAANNWIYRLLFYFIVFFLVGVVLSLPAVRAWPRKYFLILIVFSLLVLPVFLEVALVYQGGSGIRPLNIALSMVVIMIVAWVFVPAVRWLFRSIVRDGA